MALVTSLPGPLSVAFRRGDEFSTLLDFSFATTGYTFAAAIYSVVTGVTVATPTLTVVSHANGQINLALSEVQTAALAASAPAFPGLRCGDWDNLAKGVQDAVTACGGVWHDDTAPPARRTRSPSAL